MSELGRGLQLLQYYRCTDLVWPFDFRQLRPDRADSRLHDSLERSEEAKPSQAKAKAIEGPSSVFAVCRCEW